MTRDEMLDHVCEALEERFRRRESYGVIVTRAELEGEELVLVMQPLGTGSHLAVRVSEAAFEVRS